MAESHAVSKHQVPIQTEEEEEEIKATYKRSCDLISTFPMCKQNSVSGMPSGRPLYQHSKELWYASMPYMAGAMVAQQHFVARPSDVIIATPPKCGTTWIKALVFTLVNRKAHTPDSGSAFLLPPHQCIPFLESQVYTEDGEALDIGSVEPPRMFSTHIPYPSLPGSILDSRCRVVYMWRDPKDAFVSGWHFSNEIRKANASAEPIPLEESLEWFCDGASGFGPFWDHVLGYWNAGKNSNNNMLFLKYEELVKDPVGQLKRLGEFLGEPFTVEEEERGVLENIVGHCSFEKMRDSEMNKTGVTKFAKISIENSSFFRQGKVDDSAKYLTPGMVERFNQITVEKFAGSRIAHWIR